MSVEWAHSPKGMVSCIHQDEPARSAWTYEERDLKSGAGSILMWTHELGQFSVRGTLPASRYIRPYGISNHRDVVSRPPGNFGQEGKS